MSRRLVVQIASLLLSGAAALAARGQIADPLKSTECKAALQALDEARQTLLAEGPPGGPRLDMARHDAALACLGRSEGRAVRSGAPQPPIAVVPPATAEPSKPPVAQAVPPLPPPRAPVITSCDPAGCWDSDGRRLNNLGPMLVGPRGNCTVQSGQVTCP